MLSHRAALLSASIVLLAACSQPSSPPVASIPSEPVAAPTVPEPASVAPATPTAAQNYEGKIIKRPAAEGGKEDGWYFVKNGERRWIRDSAWLGQNGFKPEDVVQVTAEEFGAIPENPLPADVVVTPSPAQ